MAGIFGNPNVLVNAGLSIMEGAPVGQAMRQAMVDDAQQQIQQRQIAEYDREQRMREMLPQLVQQVDPSDPQGSFQKLLQSGVDVNTATKIVETGLEIGKQQQSSKLIGQLTGGGAEFENVEAPGRPSGGHIDPSRLAALGIATGNPLFLQLAQFEQQKGETDRRLKVDEQRLEQTDPYTKKTEENKAEREEAILTNIEGAQSFLTKTKKLRDALKASGDVTGVVSGTDSWQKATKFLGSASADQRDALQAMIADLELDVARMKLKGQGAITDSERDIARATLPKLTSNSAANLSVLDNLESEAKSILKKHGRAEQVQSESPEAAAPASIPPELSKAGITPEILQEYLKSKGVK